MESELSVFSDTGFDQFFDDLIGHTRRGKVQIIIGGKCRVILFCQHGFYGRIVYKAFPQIHRCGFVGIFDLFCIGKESAMKIAVCSAGCIQLIQIGGFVRQDKIDLCIL